MPFSQVHFHKYEKVCRDLCSVGHAKICCCFSKICKAKIELDRKKNLILENATPKAITEVYFELLVTNFNTQISCSRHSKFVQIIPILMRRIANAVFVYISFPASAKIFWLLTCPANSGQK